MGAEALPPQGPCAAATRRFLSLLIRRFSLNSELVSSSPRLKCACFDHLCGGWRDLGGGGEIGVMNTTCNLNNNHLHHGPGWSHRPTTGFNLWSCRTPLPAAVFRLPPSLWMGELTSVSYFRDSSQRGASSSSYTCEQFLLFSQWQSRVGTPCPLVLQLDQACEGQQLLPADSSDHCWSPFHDL